MKSGNVAGSDTCAGMEMSRRKDSWIFKLIVYYNHGDWEDAYGEQEIEIGEKDRASKIKWFSEVFLCLCH